MFYNEFIIFHCFRDFPKMEFCYPSCSLAEAVLLCPWLHLCCKTTQRLQGHLNKRDQATSQRATAPEGLREVKLLTKLAPLAQPLPRSPNRSHHPETIPQRPRKAQQNQRRDHLLQNHLHRQVEVKARRAGPLGPHQSRNGRKWTLSPV